jgi:hypothetical protein
MLKGHTKYVRPCSNEIIPNENQELLFYCIKFYLSHLLLLLLFLLLTLYYILFLTAFAKLRKAAISVVTSVCLSVRPSVRI